MPRLAHRRILSFVIGGAAACCGAAAVHAGPPPNAGLAAQVTALQAQVANLAAQVGTLQNAMSALQATSGAVSVWKDTRASVAVQRNDATFVSDWTLSTMASVSLPAGTYLVVAKTSVQDPVVSASIFFCHLTRAADVIDESAAYSVSDEPETMALQGVVTLASPDTVALKCGASGPASTPGSAESFVSEIAAIKANPQ